MTPLILLAALVFRATFLALTPNPKGQGKPKAKQNKHKKNRAQTLKGQTPKKAEEEKGKQPNAFNRMAAGLIMQAMYGPRLARWDLLRCVGWLSTYLTKWTRAEDKKLQRLVSYIKASLGRRQVGFIGDPLSKCKLSLYSDSDFAGDRRDMKSTSGGVLVLTGPHTLSH